MNWKYSSGEKQMRGSEVHKQWTGHGVASDAEHAQDQHKERLMGWDKDRDSSLTNYHHRQNRVALCTPETHTGSTHHRNIIALVI